MTIIFSFTLGAIVGSVLVWLAIEGAAHWERYQYQVRERQRVHSEMERYLRRHGVR